MSFTDDDVRASHTIRIFGTNKDDEILREVWIDLERIDVYRMTTKNPDGDFQGVFRRLYWLDDPDDYASDTGRGPGAGNNVRSNGKKKICSPDEEDQEDPEEWVPVETVIEMHWNLNRSEYEEWKATRGNRTDAENASRAVEARRCYFRETIVDKIVEKVIENNPDWKQVVFPSHKYNFVDETEDKDNYVEVQYVSSTLEMSGRKEDEERRQEVQFGLKNAFYLSITDKAKGPVNENRGFDPPWALDPFQAIVNVNWGGLAVEFGSRDEEPKKLQDIDDE